MASGSFARIVSRALLDAGLLVVLLLVGEPSAIGHPADVEAALLHRRLDVSAVRQWHRGSESWRPLELPAAKVYVVNLWAIHCKPCIAEFPQLRNVAAGWKTKSEVQFVFLADPPSETTEAEVVAFWQKNQTALPDIDPSRSYSDVIRRGLDNDQEPITLLLDENLVVRQSFIGGIGERPLGRAIERLLQAIKNVESRSARLKPGR